MCVCVCVTELLPVAALPPQARRWGAPRQWTKTSSNMEKVLSKPTPLNLQETAAECVYIGRPLVHRILPSASPRDPDPEQES